MFLALTFHTVYVVFLKYLPVQYTTYRHKYRYTHKNSFNSHFPGSRLPPWFVS